MAGCEKSDGDSNTSSIQGLYVGSVANSTSSQFYALSIKADGKLTFEGFTDNQEQFGAGTWTLQGSTFTATVTTVYGFASNVGVQQTLNATYSNGVLSGTYQITSPVADSGTFSVTEVD
jgi:hypothetical protein